MYLSLNINMVFIGRPVVKALYGLPGIVGNYKFQFSTLHIITNLTIQTLTTRIPSYAKINPTLPNLKLDMTCVVSIDKYSIVRLQCLSE